MDCFYLFIYNFSPQKDQWYGNVLQSIRSQRDVRTYWPSAMRAHISLEGGGGEEMDWIRQQTRKTIRKIDPSLSVNHLRYMLDLQIKSAS